MHRAVLVVLMAVVGVSQYGPRTGCLAGEIMALPLNGGELRNKSILPLHRLNFLKGTNTGIHRTDTPSKKAPSPAPPCNSLSRRRPCE